MGAANDESNYHATPKRTYLFTILAEATFILVWLAYFTCVANQYCDLMNEKYDRDAAEVKKQKEIKDKEDKEEKERLAKEEKDKKN